MSFCMIILLKWYYDQIFTSWFFLGVSHRILSQNQNTIYRLQMSALVLEIFKFEKCVKYANEITDDVIHSTQFYMKYINSQSYFGQFAAQTIEPWKANSATENTHPMA